MGKLRLAGLFLFCLLAMACSKSSDGTGEGDGLNDGNIPVPEVGSELKDVHFGFDSSSLSPAGQGILREDGRWLLDNPSVKVIIEGHCDERGTAEYNMALGERRAQTAYDFLRSLGVKTDKMQTVSYGKELPLDSASNEEAWAKNRRVHFSVKK